MTDVDRVIHEPVRLRAMMVLSGVDSVDFNFLRTALQLSKGNLSSHMSRLENAGYIAVAKSFRGKTPHTEYRLTDEGKDALSRYWEILDGLRDLAGQDGHADRH